MNRNYRKTDPLTSALAGRQVEKDGSARHHRAMCFEAVMQMPGLTAREIEDRLGIKAHKRLPELRRAGMVRNGRPRTCSDQRQAGHDLAAQRPRRQRRSRRMTLMNSLITTTTPTPPKMIVYGQPGVGKTTFAASARAILLDCENGAGAVPGLTRTPYLQSWPQMRKWLAELADLSKADAPQALAIDTIDWMVQRIVEHVVLDLDAKATGDITNTLGTAHGGYFKAREIVQNIVYRDLLPMLNAVADTGRGDHPPGPRDQHEDDHARGLRPASGLAGPSPLDRTALHRVGRRGALRMPERRGSHPADRGHERDHGEEPLRPAGRA